MLEDVIGGPGVASGVDRLAALNLKLLRGPGAFCVADHFAALCFKMG